MRRFCGCKKQSKYNKIRNFILQKLLRFFGRMENKLWRELYVLQPTQRCTCVRKNKDMQEFTKRVSSQSPNPDMFKKSNCVVRDDKDYT
jgi:hypothetical protein